MHEEPHTSIRPSPSFLRLLVSYCLERDTLLRSIKTALVVGTILALINHGQQFLSGSFSPSWVVPMLITYIVPFTVATYGQVQGKRQRDRLQANVSTVAEMDTLPLRVFLQKEGRPQTNHSISTTPLRFAPSIHTSYSSSSLKSKVHLVSVPDTMHLVSLRRSDSGT